MIGALDVNVILVERFILLKIPDYFLVSAIMSRANRLII